MREDYFEVSQVHRTMKTNSFWAIFVFPFSKVFQHITGKVNVLQKNSTPLKHCHMPVKISFISIVLISTSSIAHRNQFFHLYQQNGFAVSKARFTHACHYDRVSESQHSKLGLRSSGKILPGQFAIAAANCCGTFLLFNKFE